MGRFVKSFLFFRDPGYLKLRTFEEDDYARIFLKPEMIEKQLFSEEAEFYQAIPMFDYKFSPCIYYGPFEYISTNLDSKNISSEEEDAYQGDIDDENLSPPPIQSSVENKGMKYVPKGGVPTIASPIGDHKVTIQISLPSTITHQTKENSDDVLPDSTKNTIDSSEQPSGLNFSIIPTGLASGLNQQLNEQKSGINSSNNLGDMTSVDTMPICSSTSTTTSSQQSGGTSISIGKEEKHSKTLRDGLDIEKTLPLLPDPLMTKLTLRSTGTCSSCLEELDSISKLTYHFFLGAKCHHEGVKCPHCKKRSMNLVHFFQKPCELHTKYIWECDFVFLSHGKYLKCDKKFEKHTPENWIDHFAEHLNHSEMGIDKSERMVLKLKFLDRVRYFTALKLIPEKNWREKLYLPRVEPKSKPQNIVVDNRSSEKKYLGQTGGLASVDYTGPTLEEVEEFEEEQKPVFDRYKDKAKSFINQHVEYLKDRMKFKKVEIFKSSLSLNNNAPYAHWYGPADSLKDLYIPSQEIYNKFSSKEILAEMNNLICLERESSEMQKDCENLAPKKWIKNSKTQLDTRDRIKANHHQFIERLLKDTDGRKYMKDHLEEVAKTSTFLDKIKLLKREYETDGMDMLSTAASILGDEALFAGGSLIVVAFAAITTFYFARQHYKKQRKEGARKPSSAADTMLSVGAKILGASAILGVIAKSMDYKAITAALSLVRDIKAFQWLWEDDYCDPTEVISEKLPCDDQESEDLLNEVENGDLTKSIYCDIRIEFRSNNKVVKCLEDADAWRFRPIKGHTTLRRLRMEHSERIKNLTQFSAVSVMVAIVCGFICWYVREDEVKNQKIRISEGRKHMSDLCEKCQQLGKPCYEDIPKCCQKFGARCRIHGHESIMQRELSVPEMVKTSLAKILPEFIANELEKDLPEVVYKCQFCGQTFISNNAFRKHLKDHPKAPEVVGVKIDNKDPKKPQKDAIILDMPIEYPEKKVVTNQGVCTSTDSESEDEEEEEGKAPKSRQKFGKTLKAKNIYGNRDKRTGRDIDDNRDVILNATGPRDPNNNDIRFSKAKKRRNIRFNTNIYEEVSAKAVVAFSNFDKLDMRSLVDAYLQWYEDYREKILKSSMPEPRKKEYLRVLQHMVKTRMFQAYKRYHKNMNVKKESEFENDIAISEEDLLIQNKILDILEDNLELPIPRSKDTVWSFLVSEVKNQEMANPHSLPPFNEDRKEDFSIPIYLKNERGDESYIFCMTKAAFTINNQNKTFCLAPWADWKMVEGLNAYYYTDVAKTKTQILMTPQCYKQIAFWSFTKLNVTGKRALVIADQEISTTHATIYARFGDVVRTLQGTVQRQADELAYGMSTENGNCGSPVLSSGKICPNMLIGIHHLGTRKGNFVENKCLYISPKTARDIWNNVSTKNSKN